MDVSDSPRPGSTGRQVLPEGQRKRGEQVLRVTGRLSWSRQDPVGGKQTLLGHEGKLWLESLCEEEMGVTGACPRQK